jgi:protein involved in polysaccharide export with SLBB domain
MRPAHPLKNSNRIFVLPVLIFILTTVTARAQRDTLRLSLPSADRTPLEEAVDSNEYVVGPGDELTIGLWGTVNQLFAVPVTPEGTALIPSVGEAHVGGLTLAEAKKEIRSVLSRRYSAAGASVTLTKIREVKIKISGAVGRPGIYTVPAYSRVSEALGKAGGISDSASRRNIELVRENGEKKLVDLLRFERGGEGKANPHIVEGERVVVPIRSDGGTEVLVAGAVNQSGLLEWRPDDSLWSLLSAAGGLLASADSSQVEIVRRSSDGEAEREIIDLREFASGNPAIGPGEQIFVRNLPNRAPHSFAGVHGEVLHPGFYDIEEGKTTLSEVMRRAGGFTPRAVLPAAYILRRGYSAPQFTFGDAINPALIERMNPEDLDFYLEKSRWRGAVVASDFVGLFEKKDLSRDVVLYSGDEIYVPATSGSVYLLGRVERPGLLSYDEGDRLGDYVRRAGGYSANAGRGSVKILKSVSGGWVKAGSGSRVDAGDVILVPRKKARFWTTVRDALAVTSNAAAIFFIVREATR